MLHALDDEQRRSWLQALRAMVPAAALPHIRLPKSHYVCLFLLEGNSFMGWERFTKSLVDACDSVGSIIPWFPKHSAMHDRYHEARREICPDAAIQPLTRDPTAARGEREAQICVGAKALLEGKMSNAYAADEHRCKRTGDTAAPVPDEWDLSVTGDGFGLPDGDGVNHNHEHGAARWHPPHELGLPWNSLDLLLPIIKSMLAENLQNVQAQWGMWQLWAPLQLTVLIRGEPVTRWVNWKGSFDGKLMWLMLGHAGQSATWFCTHCVHDKRCFSWVCCEELLLVPEVVPSLRAAVESKLIDASEAQTCQRTVLPVVVDVLQPPCLPSPHPPALADAPTMMPAPLAPASLASAPHAHAPAPAPGAPCACEPVLRTTAASSAQLAQAIDLADARAVHEPLAAAVADDAPAEFATPTAAAHPVRLTFDSSPAATMSPAQRAAHHAQAMLTASALRQYCLSQASPMRARGAHSQSPASQGTQTPGGQHGNPVDAATDIADLNNANVPALAQPGSMPSPQRPSARISDRLAAKRERPPPPMNMDSDWHMGAVSDNDEAADEAADEADDGDVWEPEGSAAAASKRCGQQKPQAAAAARARAPGDAQPQPQPAAAAQVQADLLDDVAASLPDDPTRPPLRTCVHGCEKDAFQPGVML